MSIYSIFGVIVDIKHAINAGATLYFILYVLHMYKQCFRQRSCYYAGPLNPHDMACHRSSSHHLTCSIPLEFEIGAGSNSAIELRFVAVAEWV